ncbi:aspartate aminotransferase family protein [Streptomyces sp. SID12501]|uniref:Diaminobutyrate--2-oxoglutarate transaminase n=1 Tax=Streptomyces sp. SID12501 TaxID=2706042 RepID=A0A6B3BLC9_9ACTN|nr:aspartate aminotransferase family protein [Streptomyces sp. SID12501]NEC84939.1 aspartate aminotransferase family protein [Streptomyces sp. SID12501]
MSVFTTMESEVRTYSRAWPTVFTTAHGAVLRDESGRSFIDFFAGAGALNYGHNPPELKEALLKYLSGDGVTHGLDMQTTAKRVFLERLRDLILTPRGLDYRVQFPGPGGTNAVEAALKLARKVTGRHTVAYFERGFHGMTLGALAVTSNPMKRAGAGVPLPHTVPVPFDNPADDDQAMARLTRALDTAAQDGPLAAVVVETVQGEGGINPARPVWLRALASWAREHDTLLVVDDIQMGCGRTGPFFSFERAGIVPDIVCLSKSISGYGMPMALTLIRPEYDAWKPGEHNGTFRGYNPAFVTAARALELFWSDSMLETRTTALGGQVGRTLAETARRHGLPAPRGCGLAWGLPFDRPGAAREVCDAAYRNGLLLETAGAHDEVAKILPPLTVAHGQLEQGLGILDEAVASVVGVRTFAA